MTNTTVGINSPPRFEVIDLAKVKFSWASQVDSHPVGNIVRAVIREGKYQSWKMFNPPTGECYIRRNHTPTEPATYLRFPKVICERKVIMKKLPLDVLGSMVECRVDSLTGEAIMYGADEKILLRVYDLRHLINLSENDLKILHKFTPHYSNKMLDEAVKYVWMVSQCVENGVHAGSKTLEDIHVVSRENHERRRARQH